MDERTRLYTRLPVEKAVEQTEPERAVEPPERFLWDSEVGGVPETSWR